MKNGKVLAMDDEKIIRDIMCEVLCDAGYEVFAAADSNEAIGLYKEAIESGHPFDVVMLDAVLTSGLNGEDTLKKLLEIDPNVKGIICSAWNKDPVLTDFHKYGFKGSLALPFKISEITGIVREVLAGSSQ